MRNATVTSVVVAVLLVLAGGLVAAGAEAGGTWRGKVVDAETGQPLEGVVIAAYWLKYQATLGGWAGGSFVACEEVVTAADGSFAIPRHREYTLPALVKVTARVVVFKPGYKPSRGGGFEDDATVPLRRSASRQERLDHHFWSGVPSVVPESCTPNLRRAVDEERRALGLSTR